MCSNHIGATIEEVLRDQDFFFFLNIPVRCTFKSMILIPHLIQYRISQKNDVACSLLSLHRMLFLKRESRGKLMRLFMRMIKSTPGKFPKEQSEKYD